ncbi:hypothetical protein Bsp3421_000254 (plasmid) [Burkholderia sp. FERM BP-3421]|jgi:hypothetical protein|uniref:hypothetical protein n=1 Tax=Burkholderia sp. FERM BP-3421 TaxID=1494466 RepID=UPI00235EB8A3|nr:hypothetical protein [Burkholderia sp. FERM BP-3421]WDD90415.1 hypothetical protein Bsp3421_000254 [Burkholderia sp. FERM BP-3421]
MNTVKGLVSAGMVALCMVTGVAHADGGIGRGGMYGPDWGMMMEKLTPDQRAQAITIQQKMMQMKMDHEDAMAKMEMDYNHEMMRMQNQLLELYKGH